VIGAAGATNISRVLEFLIIIIATHGQREKYGFINDLYKKVNITKDLLARVLKQGLPLLINEALWSSGMAFLNQCYSYTSQDVVPALNIESTIWNLLSVTFMAFGIAVGIITGHNLGARDFELAKANAKKLMTMSFLVSIVISLVSIGISFSFPLIYNTTNEIRALSTSLIIVSSAFMPLDSLSHSSYFVLRSGGKTWITFIFDSLYVWFIFIPIAFCLSRFTNLSVVPIMALVQSTLLFKSIMGVILVKKGVWINNIVENT
ncbi:MAG: MATE family efflux transporter, partial [Clostridia bacterium]|nr:MATE family efflux transporter [Clostridia bacterium]